MENFENSGLLIHENKLAQMHSAKYLSIREPQNFRVLMYDTCPDVDELHFHSYLQIWYVSEGSYRHFFAGNDFHLEKGSLMLVPPYCPHFIDTRNGAKLGRLDIPIEFLDSIFGEQSKDTIFNMIYFDPILVQLDKLNPYRYLSESAIAETEEIFRELSHEYLKNDNFTHLFIRANLSRLFALIAKEYQFQDRDKTVSNYREAFQNAIAYINKHYMEKISVDNVCKIALLSRRSFFYLFKQMMGMSFTSYLQYLRILRAQELLRTTDQTQYAICLNCGFSDQAYFHRVFKKHTGMLPGQYRASFDNQNH